jgi:anti-anti-sigma factor
MSSSSPLRPPGDISLRMEEGRCVLYLHGEIDMAVVEAFETGAELAVGQAMRIDVIDAGEVTFFSSAGIRLLLQLTEGARSAGSRPVLRQPSKTILQLLRVTQLESFFDIAD